jgi:hypothetical protein
MTFEPFDVDEIVAETELAMLLRFEDGEERWIPKSVIEEPHEVRDGDVNVRVSIAEWFAKKENLL